MKITLELHTNGVDFVASIPTGDSIQTVTIKGDERGVKTLRHILNPPTAFDESRAPTLGTDTVPVQHMVDDWVRRGGTPTTPATLRAEKAKAELADMGINFDTLKINLSNLPRRR